MFKGSMPTSKPTDPSMPFLQLGKEPTGAMLDMQKEFLDACEQASRAGIACVKSEIDFWSALATKLMASRSAPEALGASQECITQRMQMAAEDWRRLSDDCQKVMQTITRSPFNGRPIAST
jgi:hypothetical protein